jgi:uncharacterized protein YoxC
MAETIEKIYCTDHDNCGMNNALLSSILAKDSANTNPMTTMALLNGGCNNQWNNPMMYFVWMWMMRWMNNGVNENGNADVQRQLQTLQNQMQDNHNSDLIMAGINGNSEAIREASNRMGCDLNALMTAVNATRASIDQVSGQIGFSSERVINAVQSGNCNIIQAVKDCCCGTQKAIIEQGYQNQLATKDQTSQILSTMNGLQYQSLDRIRDLGSGIAQGFASTAFETKSQTCEIVKNNDMNTQRILDALNNHWSLETSQKLQDAKFEISQLKQNQYLAGLVTGNLGCGCGCNTGC